MITETSVDPKRLFRSLLLQAHIDQPTGFYAASYQFQDQDGRHVYIGSTDQLDARFKRHISVSTWVQFAHSGQIVWHPSLGQSRITETLAIGEHDPLFNIAGTSPGARRRLVEYLVACRRLDLLTPAVKLG